jgi:putative ABC transport system permease protein
MDSLLQDLRFAVRTLIRSPGFTLVAVLTLALGIGANTAIFTVIDAVLLRPLPYAEPDRLVDVNHFYPALNNLRAGVSVPGFRDYSARRDVFERSAVERPVAMNLTGAGEPERAAVTLASGDFFATLGVAAALGRTLRPEEAQAGHNHEVVLSDGFWRRKFGAARTAIGSRLQLNGESYEVVGVMPPDFRDFFNARTDLWAPIVFQPADFGDDRRTNEFLSFVGRLAPGVSGDQAQARMHELAGQLKATYQNSYSPDWTLQVTSLDEEARGGIRRSLYILLGAVGFVLLIACANVANLQLARIAGRSRELAVRVALGAAPGRLVRQLLTESVLLSTIGGALGLLVAAWGVPALVAINPRGLPAGASLRPDLVVLGFTLGVALLAGLLFGLVPALQIGRADVHDALKEGGRGAVSDRRSLRLRRGLVVTTVALALTLVAGAGLLLRSFSKLIGVDPGFQPDHLLTFQVSLPRAKYPNDTVRADALARLDAALAAAPGVVAAGGATNIPFDGGWGTASFNVEGYQPPKGSEMPWGDVRAATPGYLAALRVALKAGRLFSDDDRVGGARVCIVDEGLARRYWPGADPVGKRITFNSFTDSNITWITVVGVVGHTLHTGFDDDRSRVQVYFPVAQLPGITFINFVVRTRGDPMAAAPAARAAVHGVDPDLPLAAMNSMDALMSLRTGPRRFSVLLLTGFAVLAMALASIGLYGVMSYVVTQRTRELGVRVALGAAARDVLALVLREGVRLAVLGVVIGVVAAVVLTRLMRTMLFGVGATDPATFVLAPLLLVSVAALASYLPARRATRVDPIEALRTE